MPPLTSFANVGAAKLRAQLRALSSGQIPALSTGRYFHPVSPGGSGTPSNALGNGTLRLAPWLVQTRTPIDRIGVDVTVVGEAGSKVRPVIYRDNGHAYPGKLVLDGGQLAGDAVAAAEATVAATLEPGLYWIGAVVQAAPTTQPTVRIVNTAYTPCVPISPGTSAPTASTALGYLQNTVTGAPPATFSTTLSVSGNVPRVFVRSA